MFKTKEEKRAAEDAWWWHQMVLCHVRHLAMFGLTPGPALQNRIDAVLAVWPPHKRYAPLSYSYMGPEAGSNWALILGYTNKLWEYTLALQALGDDTLKRYAAFDAGDNFRDLLSDPETNSIGFTEKEHEPIQF